MLSFVDIQRTANSNGGEISDNGTAGTGYTRYLNHKGSEIELPNVLHSCQKHKFPDKPTSSPSIHTISRTLCQSESESSFRPFTNERRSLNLANLRCCAER